MKYEKDSVKKSALFDKIMDAEYRLRQTPAPVTPQEKQVWIDRLGARTRNERAFKIERDEELAEKRR